MISQPSIVWGTSGSKNFLDQVSAFRPSHFYVVQAVYRSQPPFSHSTICFGISDYYGQFQIRSGTTVSLGAG
jgi:hypothetical protein